MHEIDWEDILLAWLHDPFDKALAIQGHEARAARYAAAAVGHDVSRRGLHRLAAGSDMIAAIAERIPSPNAGDVGERAVGPNDGLKIVHPASGTHANLKLCEIDPNLAVEVIEKIVHDLNEPRERYLATWRLLPDAVAEAFGDDMARLPADTRIPDHTLFQHADITAGLYAAEASRGDAAFLSFTLGPVQSFIEAARSVRDLWSGSAMLSWLAFQAMKPIIKRQGPTAFVFPALRGATLMDLWLRRETGLGNRVPHPKPATLRAPSLPHRFVAVVPWGKNGAIAKELRQACIDAARDGWVRLAEAVRTRFNAELPIYCRDWDCLWRAQIEDALEFRAAVAPERELSDDRLARLVGEAKFSSAWPESQKIRDLCEAIPVKHRPSYDQNDAGRWQAQMEISARLMAAERAVRHVPMAVDVKVGEGPVPAKCTLFGSWEQMGPADLRESRNFWQEVSSHVSVEGVRIRPRERLSAVALTKRFAGPVLIAEELGLSSAELRFPDTPTVAASEWLARAGIDPEMERIRKHHWSGLWLHWRKRNEQDKDEANKPDKDLWRRIRDARKSLGWPQAYYAVIAMDGDEIGRWLAGEKIPELQELLHPKMRDYFRGLDDERAKAGLSARRPVGPALHAAISSALSTFASEVAPGIVAENHGTMIYSGGDDLLALCPIRNAFQCASALRDAFSGRGDAADAGWRACGDRYRITMGARASMSAGIALVHYHDDLRIALETARAGSARAKKAGRDCLVLVTARRSGATTSALCPWQCAPWFKEMLDRFVNGASDRWIYRLHSELPTLASCSLPIPAIRAELKRLADPGREDGKGPTGDAVAVGFDSYRSARGEGAHDEALRDFVTLSQSMAFMARSSDG